MSDRDVLRVRASRLRDQLRVARTLDRRSLEHELAEVERQIATLDSTARAAHDADRLRHAMGAARRRRGSSAPAPAIPAEPAAPARGDGRGEFHSLATLMSAISGVAKRLREERSPAARARLERTAKALAAQLRHARRAGDWCKLRDLYRQGKVQTRGLQPQSKALQPLGDRQVRITISTANEDRDGDIIEPDGIDFDAFLRTRTVLFGHDQSRPIARAVSVERTRDGLRALAQFPAEGINEDSDRVYGLIREGVLNSASIGFLPLDVELRDSSFGMVGFRVTRAELLEFSIVSVPSNRESLVEERMHHA